MAKAVTSKRSTLLSLLIISLQKLRKYAESICSLFYDNEEKGSEEKKSLCFSSYSHWHFSPTFSHLAFQKICIFNLNISQRRRKKNHEWRQKRDSRYNSGRVRGGANWAANKIYETENMQQKSSLSLAKWGKNVTHISCSKETCPNRENHATSQRGQYFISVLLLSRRRINIGLFLIYAFSTAIRKCAGLRRNATRKVVWPLSAIKIGAKPPFEIAFA